MKLVGWDGLFSHVSQKSKVPPQGLFGGLPGRCSTWIINEGTPEERVLEYAMGDPIELDYGDTITVLTASGGGYGDPVERDPEMVRRDVTMGLVSLKRAREVYRVAIDPETLEVDEAAMKALRA